MNQIEFDTLCFLRKNAGATQRIISEAIGVSLGAVNKALAGLREEALVEGAFITKLGEDALEEHRVDNAVIMAAGLSSRFAPISYERPKGVLKVRGEVLIERKIRQLQEDVIGYIREVVGYNKEEIF